MTEPTPSTIKNRIVTIAAASAGITTATDKFKDNESPFTAAECPAVVVEMIYRPPRLTPVDRHNFEMETGYTLKFMARRFAADYKLTDQVAWEAVEPFVLSLPAFFYARPQLQHNDNGLAIGSDLLEVVSLMPIAFESALYASAVFVLNVRTRHSV